MCIRDRSQTVKANILPVSYTHLRAHETDSYLVCRLLIEKSFWVVTARCTARPGTVQTPLLFFQAEDGIRDRSPSRGLGDVYKRQFATSVNEKHEINILLKKFSLVVFKLSLIHI